MKPGISPTQNKAGADLGVALEFSIFPLGIVHEGGLPTLGHGKQQCLGGYMIPGIRQVNTAEQVGI